MIIILEYQQILILQDVTNRRSKSSSAEEILASEE
jgi:hypothetical protein